MPGVNIQMYIHEKLAKSGEGKKENAKLLARDLIQLNVAIFQKMDLNELNHMNWTKPTDSTGLDISPNVTESIKKYNTISNMVTSDLLEATSKKHQERIYKFYTQVANECAESGDFDTAQAIHTGLEATPVFRLKYLPEAGGKKKEELGKLFSSGGKYSNLREATEQKINNKEFCIPYLGTTLTDITLIKEGNPDLVKRRNLTKKVLHLINEAKDRLKDTELTPPQTNIGERISTYQIVPDEKLDQLTQQIHSRSAVKEGAPPDFSANKVVAVKNNEGSIKKILTKKEAVVAAALVMNPVLTIGYQIAKKGMKSYVTNNKGYSPKEENQVPSTKFKQAPKSG